MTTLPEIRKRIRSARTTAKVTRAMQTVSASKMRRAQRLTLASRPYAGLSWEVLTSLVAHLSPSQRRSQPLLGARPVQSVLAVILTANRGLCGAYNHNVIQATLSFITGQTAPVRVVTVGRKGCDFMARQGVDIVGDFDMPDRPSLEAARPIARLLMSDLQCGLADQVWLIYTEFVSFMVQRPTVRLLLPLEATLDKAAAKSGARYLFEPRRQDMLQPMLQHFTEMQVYQALLEAFASEHSARMAAMRSASENARNLIGELTVHYNRVRQEAITREIIDIAGGAAALARET